MPGKVARRRWDSVLEEEGKFDTVKENLGIVSCLVKTWFRELTWPQVMKSSCYVFYSVVAKPLKVMICESFPQLLVVWLSSTLLSRLNVSSLAVVYMQASRSPVSRFVVWDRGVSAEAVSGSESILGHGVCSLSTLGLVWQLALWTSTSQKSSSQLSMETDACLHSH